MTADTGAGVSLIHSEEAERKGMRINRSESHLYRIRDASGNLMNIVGTVKLYTVPKGTCEAYCLRAIITDSMSGVKGLLGYPDMLKLSMLPSSFPMVDTHHCLAKMKDGKFPEKCSVDKVNSDITSITFKKTNEEKADEFVREERITSVVADETKEEKDETEEEKEKELSVPFDALVLSKGQAVITTGLPPRGVNCKTGLT